MKTDLGRLPYDTGVWYMETQAESTAPVDATEVDSEVTATQGEGSAPSGSEAPASGDDRSNWSEKAQKRYDELTEARYREAARADRESYRREQLERELETLRQVPAKTEPVAQVDDYPSLESFDFDTAKHAAAVAQWAVKQARESVRTELTEERTTVQKQQAQREHERREAEFTKAKPDYAEKVLRHPRDGGPVITDHMAEVIEASEMGPDIAYYLGENVAKAAEIARLPAFLQAAELGAIRAKLEAAKVAPPPVSKAPPPVGKIEGSTSFVSLDPSSAESDNIDPDKWLKARLRQVKKLK